MNPPPPPKNILVYQKFKRQRGFSLWIDCLDLLCFHAVTRSPRLNGAVWPPGARILQALYSLQGLSVSKAAHP